MAGSASLVFLLLSAAPTVDVYTMGVGDYIFEHFGHAAICVEQRCYNYGTADFSTPVPLTWNFIRGRAMFWVSVADRDRMIGWYKRADRSVWRQTIPLSESEAVALAGALEKSTGENEKYYRYHHFLDNCTTRIRDHIDEALHGALKQKTTAEFIEPSYRDYAREGFAGDAGLLLAAELVLGRASDQPTSSWQGMFLPSVFRRELETKLGAKPVLIYERQKVDPPAARWLGQGLMTLLGVVLGALIFLSRGHRATIVLSGFILGLFGAVLWFLAMASAFEELRMNEVLLVLVPFDFALGIVPERVRHIYVRVRAAGLLIVALLSIFGVFIQPLLAPISMVALPMIATRLHAVLRTRSAGVLH